MDGVRSVRGPADPMRTRPKTGRGGFALPPEQADASRPAEEVTPAEVGGLLLLQQHDMPEQRNRATRRRCDDLLRALGELQLGMLTAGTDPDVVRRLAALTAALPQAADPALVGLARMISLRARIEVARRNGAI